MCKKILFLLPSVTIGGAENTLKYLIQALNKKINITLCIPKELKPYFLQSRSKIKLHYLNGVSSWFENRQEIRKQIDSVASLLLNERPDVAIGMMHYASYLLCKAKEKSSVNSKIVSSPRGPSYYYLKYFEKDPERQRYLRLYFRELCELADYILVASEGMRTECIKFWGAKENNTFVISNGVDAIWIKQKSAEMVNFWPFDGESPILIASGRLSYEKRFDLLLKAFQLLNETVNLNLILLGDGPLKRDLKALSEQLGVHTKIYFAGFKYNPFKYIAKSDIFIHTCLFEGFGNVLVEAMACNLPVVSVDCPYGPREILNKGEYGLLSDPDPHKLSETVKILLKNPGLRNHYIKSGKRLVNTKFSIENTSKKLHKFLQSIL